MTWYHLYIGHIEIKGFDEGLINNKDNDQKEGVDEPHALMNRFDAFPLTPQQLARIAVSRAVGGEQFASSIRFMAPLLAASALVCRQPTEELLTSAEMVGLI